MILADEPAYSLPPIARALKFDDFDRLLVRLVNDSIPRPSRPSVERKPTISPSPVAGSASQGAEVRVPRQAGGGDGGDYWTDTATDPGGYHGEIELTPVGAVPVAELEG